MQIQTAKGVRDIYPEEGIILEGALSVLRKNFALFGFNPLDTPILEMFETLSSKYTGGAEILKETFKLTDQGKRELGLRYDLTVPFARFVATNPVLKMPFKRYQIGRVFRDGPITANRLREFTQCDCDIVGTKSIAADAECVELFLRCFADLELPVVVRVNNRKILDSVMDVLKIKYDLRERVILAVDKLDKKSVVEVQKEIAELGISSAVISKLFEVLNATGGNPKVLAIVEKLIGKENEGLKELRELLELCNSDDVVFVPSLARGLAYYTGSIFEVYVKNGSIKSSIGSGGRYDKMISQLMGSPQEYPAVGCSFGLDVILNALKAKQTEKGISKSVVQVYVVPIGLRLTQVWPVVSALREKGISTDVSFAGKGVSKGLDFASKLGIPYVAIIGDKELAEEKVMLKDMNSGTEQLLSLSEVMKKMKSGEK
jgi:histidyl-tRNA synthetase